MFTAILRRDLAVAVSDAWSTVAQMVLQPVFLLFVFGRVLTSLDFTRDEYLDVFFPGIVGLTAVLTGVQFTALPLVLEFSYSMEIEDRLLAPIDTRLLAIEKIVFASLRAALAAVLMLPIGYLVLGRLPGDLGAVPAVTLFVALGSFVGGALGLVLGTIIPPPKIRMMMTLIITPLMFTGASQYPWSALHDMRWFQVVSALNPLTYVNEGLRSVLAPDVDHLPTALCFVVLLVVLVGLSEIGIRNFERRAVS